MFDILWLKLWWTSKFFVSLDFHKPQTTEREKIIGRLTSGLLSSIDHIVLNYALYISFLNEQRKEMDRLPQTSDFKQPRLGARGRFGMVRVRALIPTVTAGLREPHQYPPLGQPTYPSPAFTWNGQHTRESGNLLTWNLKEPSQANRKGDSAPGKTLRLPHQIQRNKQNGTSVHLNSFHLHELCSCFLQLLHRQLPKVSQVGLEEKAIQEEVRGGPVHEASEYNIHPLPRVARWSTGHPVKQRKIFSVSLIQDLRPKYTKNYLLIWFSEIQI